MRRWPIVKPIAAVNVRPALAYHWISFKIEAPVAANVAPVVLADLTRQAEFIGVARAERVSPRSLSLSIGRRPPLF
jgi:hypothetical protein